MLEETALVVEADQQSLWVELPSRSACSQCGSGTCTTSVIAKLFRVSKPRFRLENSLNARPGQQVVVGIPDDLVAKASLWAYLLPMVTLLAGAAVANVAGAGEGIQSLMALVGLGVGLLLVRRLTTTGSMQRRLRPTLLRLAQPTQVSIEFTSLTRS